MSDYWKSKRVCITGGAGFIGSHLADALVDVAREVVVADDFSSGSHANVPEGALVNHVDLRNFYTCLSVVRNCDVVFHLASDVGGRAYLTNNKLWGNLELDAALFRACVQSKVEKVVYFSSACVYRTDLHGYLHESDTEIGKADGVYGTTKLIGEQILSDFPLESVSVRPFTVYGERMKENRSIGALIAKTFIQQDPFEVWGDGNQVMNWIYVRDVINGVLIAAERLNGGAVNIGSEDVRTPLGALRIIWDYVGWKPKEIVFRTDMPTSPARMSNNTRIRNLGWNRDYSFEQGLRNTVAWYYGTHSVEDVRESLEKKLVGR